MRAAIFIDGAYVRTQFKMHKIDPDYADMADYFLNPLRSSFPLDLLRCYYYDCAPYMSPEPTEDELKRMEVHKSFVENLLSLGRWAIRLGKLQKRWEGQREYYEQKRVDVLLSVDLVRHAAAGHIQHAVLVAGDSDFVPAVEAAKEHGVTVSLWCGHANTVHRDLISLADEVYTFEWGDFPRLNEESSAQDNGQGGQKKFKKRRRRGGRGRGGRRPEGTSEDNATKDPGIELDSDGKSSWGDRLKRFTGLK
ncbi:MAG TPA: NYN domain-containing protein [Oligoflexus sp.]|uniref:NYN domain-containing protein n=1 Tax=Oligoflexus sp. TaxID=1971216 RepID=UPI002D80A501|nr:NYN domain-containing protein [Oligoflexus sp.]HET9235613.1 NYN domain-containing protein [Oligoflexus sp.]